VTLLLRHMRRLLARRRRRAVSEKESGHGADVARRPLMVSVGAVIVEIELTLASTTPVLAGGKGGAGGGTQGSTLNIEGIKGESQNDQHKSTIERVAPSSKKGALPYQNTSTNHR
jgi:hypothetical protein